MTDGLTKRSPEQIRLMIDLGVLDPVRDDTFCAHFMWFEVIAEFRQLFGGALNVPSGTSIDQTISKMPKADRVAFRDRVLVRAKTLKARSTPASNRGIFASYG